MARCLRQRSRQPEWMDAPEVDSEALSRSLLFIRRINTWLGYTRATVSHLEGFIRSRTPGGRIRILDVGTGSGDIPQAILNWANRLGLDVEIVGIDLHHKTLAAAQEFCASGEIQFVRADANRLPFGDRSFDFVLSSMFLHHLDEAVVVEVLKELDRVASRGLIVADLLRSCRAYLWITLFTQLSHPIIRHDARVSVTGAFNQAEMLSLRDAAGMQYLQPYRHFGHRLVLAGMKPLFPQRLNDFEK